MPREDRLPDSLRSGRLLIRVARPGDGAMFSAALHDSHAGLAPRLGRVSPPPSPDEAEQRCVAAHERFQRNERSRRLAERAGFEYEGTLRQDRPDLQGRLRSTRVYAIVRPS
jgi:hypothetical protein